MLKCKVFRTDWSNKNDLGPSYYFNKFCEENPDLEVIKIDTLSNNGDPQIFLYYKEPETIYSNCSVHNSTRNPIIQKDNLIYYLNDGKEVIAKILQCDPADDRIIISFRDGNIVNQAHISYKNVSLVPDSIEVSNFKPGDFVIYRCNGYNYVATILRTYHAKCIIEYAGNIVETRYAYIDKMEN